MTSASGHWTFESSVTPTYDSNGVSLATSTWNGIFYDTEVTTPFELEYVVVSGSGNGFGYIGIWNPNDMSSSTFQYHNNGNTVICDLNQATVNVASYAGKYNLKVLSDKYELYKEDQLIYTYTRTNESSLKIKFTSGNGRSFKFKDVVIKPL